MQSLMVSYLLHTNEFHLRKGTKVSYLNIFVNWHDLQTFRVKLWWQKSETQENKIPEDQQGNIAGFSV